METVKDIKEALSAKSRTATLDELRSEGRRKVRLIRAEHIAAMVSDAVHVAIKESGLIDPSEHESLVEKSRAEFREILNEREREQQRAREVEQKLEQSERELEASESEVEQARAETEQVRGMLADLEAELEQARADAEEARAEAAKAAEAPAQANGVNELLMTMFQELATMKANMQATQQAAPAAAAPDLSGALDKLTSSLNERLESFGKKMGISAAVESDTADFSGLFKAADASLESNMENVEIKQKTGGGIAANLARLKKLKGGG